MSIDTGVLRALPAAEKLRLIEMLWDDLNESDEPVTLPDYVEHEAVRRRDEMLRDPNHRLTHEEVWRRIDGRCN